MIFLDGLPALSAFRLERLNRDLQRAVRGTRLRTLVATAGARWAVEESFQTAKNEAGLDQYQVRRYDAWYAHITLAMAAAAFLVITRAAEAIKGAPPQAVARTA